MEVMMSRKPILLLLLVLLLCGFAACSKDKDDDPDTSPFNFANETAFYDWLDNHAWGVGAYPYFEKDGFVGLDVIIDYYQDHGNIDLDADYSLTINGLDCPVYTDGEEDEEVYTYDLDLPVATSLHYVFKINNVTMIDRTVPIPAQPTMTEPENPDFTQPLTFSWTMASNARLQFFYGYGYNPNISEDQYVNKLLPVSARSYTMPANTFTAPVEDYDFDLEESNLAEQGSNLAWVSQSDYHGSKQAGLARGLAHWGSRERRKFR